MTSAQASADAGPSCAASCGEPAVQASDTASRTTQPSITNTNPVQRNLERASIKPTTDPAAQPKAADVVPTEPVSGHAQTIPVTPYTSVRNAELSMDSLGVCIRPSHGRGAATQSSTAPSRI